MPICIRPRYTSILCSQLHNNGEYTQAVLKDFTPSNEYIPPQTMNNIINIDIHSSHILQHTREQLTQPTVLKLAVMIWVIPVLLLLAGGGCAVPLVDSQMVKRNNGETELHETVEEMQEQIQLLHSKLQELDNQLSNGVSGWGALIQWKGESAYTHKYI